MDPSVGYASLKDDNMVSQRGRSMVEMLGVLAVIGVLSVIGFSAFSSVIDRFRANDLLEEASARAMRVSEQIKKGRKTLSLGKFLDNETLGGTFSKKVFTDGLHQQFGIQVSGVKKSVCKNLLNSITDTTPLRRLSLSNLPRVPLTECGDDNTFLMIYNTGIKGGEKDTLYRCESDADCSTVCASCNENNLCVNECEIPVPDSLASYGEECGTNECMVYDEETQTCKMACERVEYLESGGGPYIDTGLHPTDTWGYKIKNTYKVGGGEQCAIGCMDSGNRFVGVYTSGRAGQLSGGWGSYVNYLTNTFDWNNDTVLEVETNYKNNRKITVNNQVLKDLTEKISGTIKNNLYLFARNYGGTITRMFGKIYYAEITNGNDTVAYFIPVISPDGDPCMFDKVSQKLFCNEGTGTFKTNKD